MEQFDLVVIGGGSAGMKAARTAARMGRRVALAEEKELGGECFWAGCVPTKAMIRAAEVWHLVRRAPEFGIHPGDIREDFAGAMEYRDRKWREVGGDGPADAGLGKLGVKYVPARASFLEPHVVRMGNEVVAADRVIIATGTIPFVPYIEGLEKAGYITNRQAVHLSTLPKSLIIVGGGAIGLEFAQVFRRFGADVTVVELGPQILPQEDGQIAELVTGYLRDEGIRVITGARPMSVESTPEGKRVTLQIADVVDSVTGEEILVAAGRAAATGDLNLEAACVDYTLRAIKLDPYLRTSRPHILAAGDVGGGYLFTHVASFEGGLAARNAFTDEPTAYDPRVVPRCTFLDPEVASVGLTETQAIAAGFETATYASSFRDLDRAILHGDPRGIVKIVTEKSTEKVLGGHLVGPYASSLLAEIAVVMQHDLPISAIAGTMHAYPSFPEAVEAAALSSPSP